MPRTSYNIFPDPATLGGTRDGKNAAGSPADRLEKAISNNEEFDAIVIVKTEHPNAHRSTASVLDSAIKQGMADLAEVLIGDGALVWQESPLKLCGSMAPCCCLCTAAMLGDVRTVRNLISSGFLSTYAEHSYYYRHMHNFACYAMAASKGTLEVVELLFNDGPAVPSRVHGTMLWYALYHGHQDIVRLLLRKGAHRPTFQDVGTALDKKEYGMLIDLLRAGGVNMRADEFDHDRAERAHAIVQMADAACAGRCSPKELRRLLKCTATDGVICGARRDYSTPATDKNHPLWLAVTGALTTYGWTCTASTPADRVRAAAAHAADCTAYAVLDDDDYDCCADHFVRARTIVQMADAVCAGKCSPEVLRRLLKCTGMATAVNGTHRDYPTPATDKNRAQWLAVTGALTTYGWICAASTPDERVRAADAHAAGCTADATHDDDYAASVYDPKGDNKPGDISSSGSDSDSESPNGGGTGETKDTGASSSKRLRRA